MLILLITCGLNYAVKDFYKKRFLIFTYIFCVCCSPISQLILGALFTPNIFCERTFSQEIFNAFKKVNSCDDLIQMYKDFNKLSLIIKRGVAYEYKNEVDFLRSNSEPGDLTLSSIPELPFYAGIYSLTPPGKFIYQDIIYSTNDSTYLKTFQTLDPHILQELNIKWILINNTEQISFPKEIKQLLKNERFFQSVYLSKNSENSWVEVFKVKDLNGYLNEYKQTASWILINKVGEPIEISYLNKETISLFQSYMSALKYLNQQIKVDSKLKKERVTIKLVINEELENYLKGNQLKISLKKVQ